MIYLNSIGTLIPYKVSRKSASNWNYSHSLFIFDSSWSTHSIDGHYSPNFREIN